MSESLSDIYSKMDTISLIERVDLFDKCKCPKCQEEVKNIKDFLELRKG